MPTQTAHNFFRLIRTDEAIKTKFKALLPVEELSPILAFAKAHGFEMSEDELRAGFKHDWAMRWFRHQSS